jgi:hypothetical protein
VGCHLSHERIVQSRQGPLKFIFMPAYTVMCRTPLQLGNFATRTGSKQLGGSNGFVGIKCRRRVPESNVVFMVSRLSLTAPTTFDASMLCTPPDFMPWRARIARRPPPKFPTSGLHSGATARARRETPGIIGSRAHCWGHCRSSCSPFKVLVFVTLRGRQDASRRNWF